MMNYQRIHEREQHLRRTFVNARYKRSLKTRILGGWNRFWIKIRRIYQ